jgi:CDGSH-type Zn-finger protein
VTSVEWTAFTSAGAPVEVEPCGDGPALVRAAAVVVDPAGTEHHVSRPVAALCTCAKSQRFPWCDSTHKSIRAR